MSTQREPWHADDAQLAAYLTGAPPSSGGRNDFAFEASLEAHLLGCADCRDRLAGVVVSAGEDDRAAGWDRLADRIDRPSTGPLARFAGGLGILPAAVATPVMLLAAVVAVLLVAVVPLVAGFVASEAAWPCLVALAPLAPVAAVALAYRPGTDPAGEIALAAPSAGLRLVALRALVVSAVALPVAVGALLAMDLWLDVPVRLGLAWALPGLALAALVLFAGTTRIDPARVAAGISIAWASGIALSTFDGRALRPDLLADALANPSTQVAALAVAVAALSLTVVRKDAVAYRRLA